MLNNLFNFFHLIDLVKINVCFIAFRYICNRLEMTVKIRNIVGFISTHTHTHKHFLFLFPQNFLRKKKIFLNVSHEAILKIIFVCGNPTDWAKNLPTQIFFFDTLKNCRLADSELRNSRVQFFFHKENLKHFLY